MNKYIIGFAISITCLAICLFASGIYTEYIRTSSPQDCNGVQLTDAAKREYLLMPQKDSQPWKDWVVKYGDTAESWELFTLGFHSKYLGELNARITKLEKAGEPNEPRKAP